MRKRKIVFVQPVLSPYTIPRYEELARDKDLDIVVLVERAYFDHRPGWVPREIKGCKVEVVGSLVAREEAVNAAAGYTISGVRTIPFRLPMLIRGHRPDVVMVCNASELVFAALLRPFLGYRIGLMVEDTRRAVEHKSRAARRLKALVYRRADFFLPFSNDSEDYLEDIGVSGRIYRTSWSLDLACFRRDASAQGGDVRARLGLRGKLVMLFVGQLVPLKGLMNLLEAWRGLPPEMMSSTVLLVIGDGPQKAAIEAFLAGHLISNVHLLGQMPGHEVARHYHEADVFILPTLKDLFSLTVMEAMACGLPILTSIYNGARELVREGENGHIFDAANPEEIRQAILAAWREKDKLAAMGRRSLELIQDYDNAKVMGRLGDFLKEV